MNSTATPQWIRYLGNLRSSARERQVRRWLMSISRPTATSPIDGLKHRLNHQLELLRDEIAEARQAGLSWSTIGKMVGLAPETVQSIHSD